MATRIFIKTTTRTPLATTTAAAWSHSTVQSQSSLPLSLSRSLHIRPSSFSSSSIITSIHHNNSSNNVITIKLPYTINHRHDSTHRWMSTIPSSSSNGTATSDEDSHNDFKAKRKVVSNIPSAESTSSQEQKSTSSSAAVPVSSDRDIDSLSDNEIQLLIENDVKTSPVFLYMKGKHGQSR
jgi:hypothetical protein